MCETVYRILDYISEFFVNIVCNVVHPIKIQIFYVFIYSE